MSGAIPPFQHAFMAWCLVKAQGQLYLHLRNHGTHPTEDLYEMKDQRKSINEPCNIKDSETS